MREGNLDIGRIITGILKVSYTRQESDRERKLGKGRTPPPPQTGQSQVTAASGGVPMTSRLADRNSDRKNPDVSSSNCFRVMVSIREITRESRGRCDNGF